MTYPETISFLQNQVDELSLLLLATAKAAQMPTTNPADGPGLTLKDLPTLVAGIVADRNRFAQSVVGSVPNSISPPSPPVKRKRK